MSGTQSWEDVLENCAYTKSAIAKDFKVSLSTLHGWVKGKNPRNKERADKLMSILQQTEKLVRHPSYGWATPQQMEQLQLLGIGPTRDNVIKEIEKQTKLKGRIK